MGVNNNSNQNNITIINKNGSDWDDTMIGIVVVTVIALIVGIVWLVRTVAAWIASVWADPIGHWVIVGLIATVLGLAALAIYGKILLRKEAAQAEEQA